MKSLLPLLFITVFSQAQSITGKWKTVNENSGEVQSIVEIFERTGKIYGRIIKIFPKEGEDPDPICNKCPESDPRFKKKIIGMEIIKDMEQTNNEFKDGSILDPEAGKVYRGKLWIEGDNLKVRGYWGPFYRTQTWMRVTKN